MDDTSKIDSISCPVCQNLCSTLAVACPKCGHPFNQKEHRSENKPEFSNASEPTGKEDPLFLDALQIAVSSNSMSTSLLQRHLRIGYGRASVILHAMVSEGYIGDTAGSSGTRPIFQKAYDYAKDNLLDAEKTTNSITSEPNRVNKIKNALKIFNTLRIIAIASFFLTFSSCFACYSNTKITYGSEEYYQKSGGGVGYGAKSSSSGGEPFNIIAVISGVVFLISGLGAGMFHDNAKLEEQNLQKKY